MSLVENYIHEYLENLQPFCEGELGQYTLSLHDALPI